IESRNDPTSGFTEFRVRLSNTTPPILRSPDGSSLPQNMSNGTLIAVIKFHRNACYSDDLQGELTDAEQFAVCRTAEEEIVVSDPITTPDQHSPVPMSGATPSSSEFTFTFSDAALPINAWDVVLQVIYRGQLGNESDGIVVATKDISEPTFITTF